MNEVEAVKGPGMRDHVERLLRERGEIYGDVWKLGVNTALRISDLLSLTFEQVNGDDFVIIEGKTKKRRQIPINTPAREVISRRQAANPSHVYLFQSDSNRSRALCKPITRFAVAKVFKETGERRSVSLSLGTHSMRKTRGYSMRKEHDIPIEEIAAMFNHSSPAVTMRYIGLDQATINKGYSDVEL